MGEFRKSTFKAVAARLGFALLAFVFLRVAFFAANHHLFPAVTTGQFIRLLFVGLRFDLAGFAYFNILYAALALAPLSFLRRGRGRLIPFGVYLLFNAAATALSCMDLVYFRYTLARSTRTVFSVAFAGNDLNSLAFAFLFDYWHVILLWAAVTAVLFIGYWYFEPRALHPLSGKERAVGTVVMLGTVALLVVFFRGGLQLRPMELNTANYLAGGENAPLLTNTPYVMVRTFLKRELPEYAHFKPDELNGLYSPVHDYSGRGAPFKPMNVVVIIMESLSRDYLPPPYGREGLAPFFASLIPRGLYLENAYANGKQSIEALPTIIASIPSLTKDPFSTGLYSTNSFDSLPSLLSAKGYDTAFFHGGRTGTMGFYAFSKVAGFNKYRGMEDYPDKSVEFGEWGVADEPYLAFFASELSQLKEPFFASVFTLSAHHPFRLPAGYEGRFPEGKHPITKMVSYADHALEKFFEKAAREPFFRNTLFVITADHTGPALSPEAGSRTGNYAIPILFYAPGDEGLKGVSTKTGQQLDIMPTVLDYLNYDRPFFAFGRSALAKGGAGFAVNSRNGENVCLSGETAFVFTDKEAGGVFDLGKDPHLRGGPLALTSPGARAVADGCRAFFQSWSTALRKNLMKPGPYLSAVK